MTRLARSPAERTRPEDRRLKFYEPWDMLRRGGVLGDVRATLRAGRLRLVFIAGQLARTQSVVSQVCG